MFFDSKEPVRDPFGRLLAYVRYDADDGGGSRDTLYNQEAVQQGHARVYDSNMSKHDDFLMTELDARANGRGVWQRSDPSNSSEFRDRDVSEVFVPNASSVRTSTGTVADSRVPLFAAPTATQDLNGGVSYSTIPLAAVDKAVNTGLLGGLSISEEHDADSAAYEQFTFVTNLLNYLGDGSGEVLIDGGHGQFGHDHSLSAEDAVYYLRHLEGEGGVGFRGINRIDSAGLSGARALVVTPPTVPYTQSEVDAVSTFCSNGGALLLLGSSRTEDLFDEPRSLLNDIAAGVGSDLRLNEDRVLDDTNNVNNDPALLLTSNVNTAFPLFSKVS